MMRRIFTIMVFVSMIFPNETIIHINSTYFDGTPKQILIYEYSTLYSNNPLKLIDTLNFDKDGKLIYDFDGYFNSNWYCDRIGNVQIANNKFKVLDSASCLGCYSYMDNWNIITKNNDFFVNLNSSIFIDKELSDESSKYNFQIRIKSTDSFMLKLGTFEYNFTRSRQ